MHKRVKRCIALAGMAVLVLGIIAGTLIWFGVIQLNGHAAKQFAVHGVDVSEYQGEIQWDVLAAQNIQFAFIKATEGSSYVDKKFSQNWQNAAKTNLRIGAYHFFSFDSSGETQADNFISTVEPVEHMLPPVVDVEYYGDYKKNPPDLEHAEQELLVLLQALEEAYQMKPLIYVTDDTFWAVRDFPAYHYWERDVLHGPPGGDKGWMWTFWQYTDREVLDGYDGEERYIDCNVFIGSEETFAAFGT